MKKFLSFVVLLCIIVFSLSAVALSPLPCTRTAEDPPCPKGHMCSGANCVSNQPLPVPPSNPPPYDLHSCNTSADCEEGYRCVSGLGICEKSPSEFKKCSKRWSCNNDGMVETGIECSYENANDGSGVMGALHHSPLPSNRSEERCKRYLGLTNVKPNHPKDKFVECSTERECTKTGGTSVMSKCCYINPKTKKKYCTDSRGVSIGSSSGGNSEGTCRSFVSDKKRLREQADALFEKYNMLRNDNEKLREKNDRLTQQYGNLEEKCNALEELCSNTPYNSQDQVSISLDGGSGGGGGDFSGGGGGNAGPLVCPACNCPGFECPPCSGTSGRRSGGASAVQ